MAAAPAPASYHLIVICHGLELLKATPLSDFLPLVKSINSHFPRDTTQVVSMPPVSIFTN